MVLAKLPNIPRILNRPRLERLMEHTTEKCLTLVCGNSGQGKTTLVTGFLKNNNYPVFWYPVDQTGPNPVKFINRLYCFVNSTLPVHSAETTRVDTIAIEEMGSEFLDYFESINPGKDIFVVLDNYHRVGSCEFDNLIQYLINNCPPELHFIIISRKEFNWDLIQKKVDRTMLEINDGQLNFTLKETKEFYKEIYNIDLEEDQLLSIFNLTNGWAAGMVIIGEMLLTKVNMQEIINQDCTTLIKTIPSLGIYLEEEIFNYLSTEEKDLFLSISIAEDITLDLVRYICGDEAVKILDRIAADNLLISCFNKTQTSYRIHPLWQAFLFNQACNTWGMDRIKEIHDLIASYYYKQEKWKESFSHYVEARNFDQAVIVLRQAGFEILDQGWTEKIDLLISQVPIEKLNNDPWVQFIYGFSFRFKDHELCYKYLNRAIDGFRKSKDFKGEIQAICLQTETLMFYPGNLHEMGDLIIDMPDITEPNTDGEWRLIGYRNIYKAWVCCYLTGETEEALRLVEKTKVIACILQDSNLKLWVVYIMALASVLKGDFEVAQGILAESIQNRNEGASDKIVITLIPYIAGMNASLMGDFEEAKDFLELALKESKDRNLAALDFYIKNYASYCDYYLGKISAGEQLIKEMGVSVGRYLNNKNYHLNSYYLLCKASYAFLQKQSYQAVELGRQALELRRMAGGEVYFLQCHLLLGAALRDIDELAEAEYHLLQAQERSSAISSSFHEISSYVQLALLYEKRGKKDLFIKYTEKAFGLASKHSYYHFFLWRDDDLARLLEYTRNMPSLKGYLELLCDYRSIPVDVIEGKVKDDINKVGENQNQLKVALGMAGTETLSSAVTNEPKKYLKLVSAAAVDKEKKAGGKKEESSKYLKLFMLGPFTLEINGEELKNIGANKALYLLKYLCMKNKPCSIEELINEMWPEWDIKLAKNNFYYTLHGLRKLLGNKDIVQFKNGLCEIKDEFYWKDIDQFNYLINKSRDLYQNKKNQQALELLNQASSLYRGEFLEGENLDTTLSLEREFINKKYYMLLINKGRILLEEGDYEKANDILIKALHSPFSEEYTYRLLMATYYKMGNQWQALDVYKKLRDYMSANMGLKPCKTTEALRDCIVNGKNLDLLDTK